MENKKEINLTKKTAIDIADKNFGHVLDCVLGYSDSGYTLKDPVSNFEQNFEEDLEERGINVTNRKIKMIADIYECKVKAFEIMVRKKHYKEPKKNKRKK